MSGFYVVYVTAPRRSASRLARRLVEESVAACVNIVPTVRSIYRWKVNIEAANESLLIVKTSKDRLKALSAVVRAHHPYSVPEIIAVPIEAGHKPYLDWIRDETRRPAAKRAGR